MALLHGKMNGIELKVRPYRLTEAGQPTWVLTQLELKESGNMVQATTFSLTTEDLAELRSRLTDLAGERRVNFALRTTDGDLIFEGWRGDLPGDVSVGFWKGQPYEVMKGYRFLAKADNVIKFVSDLLYDETVVLQPSRLP